jgi:regulatory subunit for Cdc7p protein kinase
MATLARNPLATMKPLANHYSATVSPWRTAVQKPSSSSKRAHSPEPPEGLSLSAKRARAAPEPARATREDPRRKDAKDTRGDSKEERDRRRAEREEEFRVKYTRAFPNWTFHFDLEAHQPELTAIKNKLERRVLQLGAVSTFVLCIMLGTELATRK